jgi:toxin secretion/phage lysis holin
MKHTAVRWGWSLAIGAIGGAWLTIFGDWTMAMTILCVCMALDYISGLVVAGVFHTSRKSAGGGLDSNVGWKGLARKVATLFIILVAHFVDVLIGTQYVRDAAVIAFTVNEIISILENCALMGVRIPKVLLKGIDILHQQTGEEDEKPPDQGEAAEAEEEVPGDD